jgi:Uma2 family endonuclease
MTPDEYIAFERGTQEKHEYVRGQVIRRAVCNLAHNLITVNLLRAVANASDAAGASCEFWSSDQKVGISEDLMLCPDGSLTCGEAQFDHRDMLRNPFAIFEVLSPSTEKEDRTDKFRDYQKIASLRHYVLIDQHQVSVTHFEKLANGLWAIVGDHTALSDMLTLRLDDDAGIAAPLFAIYRRVPLAKSGADGAAC